MIRRTCTSCEVAAAAAGCPLTGHPRRHTASSPALPGRSLPIARTAEQCAVRAQADLAVRTPSCVLRHKRAPVGQRSASR